MVYDYLKRLVDIIGSMAGLLILWPLFLVVAVLIKLESPGPIFYTPTRVGKNDKLFKMYKFRSMIANAEEILKNDRKLLAEYKKSSYKLNKDPRLTKIGPFLRKSSIDELPQFINILRGEMSLVGPRAYLPHELEEQTQIYPQTKPLLKTVLLAKPGLTGYWQVSGRSLINFDRRIMMDVEYVKKKSVLFDLWLILRTIPAILTSRGAV